MLNIEIENCINEKLKSSKIKDYVPNGLQVEGRKDVNRIITGVTACQALLDAALLQNADAVMVHHGYFWKNEQTIIRGMKRKRLKTIITNDINLYAWHLPLDIHPELGNNTQIAAALGIKVTGRLAQLVQQGEFYIPIKGDILRHRMEQFFGRKVLHFSESAPYKIKRIAWCSGSGQKFIYLAADAKIDAFISGEVSEDTIHISREMGIHFFACGHHATERGGIVALGKWLVKNYDLDIMFIDINNPA